MTEPARQSASARDARDRDRDDGGGDSDATAGLRPLPRSFFERPTIDVAHDLLGKSLVRPMRRGDHSGGATAPGAIVARIVEVEAYLGLRDAASHARRGPTPRAAIMFGPPGRLYVYLIYGVHHCMNFITEPDGDAGAVLIRAAEPIAGLPLSSTSADARPMRGPGKLCRALGIDRGDNGLDLTAGTGLFVADAGDPAPARAVSRRVGVEYAGAWARRKLRFYIRDNPHVSAHPRG